jgi:hypothetical protein
MVDADGLRPHRIVSLLVAMFQKGIGRSGQVGKLEIRILPSDEAGGNLEMLLGLKVIQPGKAEFATLGTGYGFAAT